MQGQQPLIVLRGGGWSKGRGRGGQGHHRVGGVDTHCPLTPHTYPPHLQDHKEMATCLAVHPTNPAVFFSGSKDRTVRVWDRRMAQCAGQCGMQDPGTFEV